MKTLEHRSIIPATMAQMLAFHNDPRALRWLTPTLVTIQRDARTSLISGELEFTLWFGPIPVLWTARHEPGPTATSFRDVMVRGPMASWEHQHEFREVGSGVELIDHLSYEHRSSGLRSLFTHLFMNDAALRVLFLYRHWRTRQIAPTYHT